MNNLETGIQDLHKGVDYGNAQVPMLLYADVIVLIADDEQSLQGSKTNVVHFRPTFVNRTAFELKNRSVIIETTGHYKHLGVMLD